METEQLVKPEHAEPAQHIERAHRQRKDGVTYKLRVIHGSDGLLELVEQPPADRGWFAEWVRVMQITGWTM